MNIQNILSLLTDETLTIMVNLEIKLNQAK